MDSSRRRWCAIAGLLGVVATHTPVASAQWPRQLSSTIPRTPKGDPDPDAASPRTSDGHPDFSGVWRGITAPAGRRLLPSRTDPPIAVYREVGQNLPDGLPITPYGLELLKARLAGSSAENPEARCLPMGVMQLHTQGAPRKFVQTPSLLLVLYEAGGEARQIFTDGRPLPAGDPQAWWNGYSVGRWEGDDLVVTTTHFRDGGWLDLIGSPLTDVATITERFRRPTFARMEIDVTVDDRKAYTRPFTVRLFQELMLGDELIEYVCLENQRFKPAPPVR
jgi:hypothetical protein